KCLRILPEICASTFRPPRSTRNIVPGNTSVTVPSVTICSSFGMKERIPDSGPLNQAAGMSISAHLLPRNRRQILTELSPFPPRAGLAVFCCGRESITIGDRADIARWAFGKWVVLEQLRHLRVSFQQTYRQSHKPLVLVIGSKRGEPHLPIEPGLVRRAPTRDAFHVARVPFELIRDPIDSVRAPFENNFAPVLRHHTEKS